MPDYKNGKIYRIVCNVTGLTYVGSTTRTLAQRLCNHRTDYKRYQAKSDRKKCSSIDVLAGGDYNIVLLEKVVCECKDQLRQRERYYIETIECVNKNIPGRTIVEYREANKEAMVEYKREYHRANKEARSEYHREYHQANRDAQNEHSRKYNEEHREELAQKRATKVNCGCGAVHSHGDSARHLKTNKHKKWVESQAWLTATCAES
jgi:hypothetical protein